MVRCHRIENRFAHVHHRPKPIRDLAIRGTACCWTGTEQLINESSRCQLDSNFSHGQRFRPKRSIAKVGCLQLKGAGRGYPLAETPVLIVPRRKNNTDDPCRPLAKRRPISFHR